MLADRNMEPVSVKYETEWISKFLKPKHKLLNKQTNKEAFLPLQYDHPNASSEPDMKNFRVRITECSTLQYIDNMILKN